MAEVVVSSSEWEEACSETPTMALFSTPAKPQGQPAAHAYLLEALPFRSHDSIFEHVSPAFWQEPIIIPAVPTDNHSRGGDMKDGDPSSDREPIAGKIKRHWKIR